MVAVVAVFTLGSVGVAATSGVATAASGTATIRVGSYPWAVAINPAGTDAYVTDSNGLSVVDLATNTVTATIPESEFAPPDIIGAITGIAINPPGTYAYVTDPESGVSVIDLATNTITATIPLGFNLTAIAINPAGTYAYVTGSVSYSVWVIDLATNTTTATIPLSAYGAYGVAINRAGTDAYVIEGGGLLVIDLATNTTTATVAISEYPAKVAVNPAGTDAYVTNGGSANTVSVIDLATNKITDTIPVGDYSNVIAINPAGTDAYVTNLYDGTMSVIDISSADIALAISGPAHAAAGAGFAEKVTVTNNGPNTATDVATNIYILPGVTVTAAPGATVHTGTLDWVEPSVATGTSITYTITFKVGSGIHATATLGGVADSNGLDLHPANNVAITTIQLG